MKAIFKNCFKRAFLTLALLFGVHILSAQVTINGDGPNGTDMMLYHKIVLTVDGPTGGENVATFKDHRMTVDFVNGTTKVTVSGYFAADGDAANTSATTGSKWRCNFRPEKTGTWTYTINFRTGTDIATKFNNDVSGSTAIAPDGTTGTFNIVASNKTGKDFRNPQRGPLKYVGKHQYKYAGSSNYFVRAGMGVPESLFTYTDFDNTPNGKPWTAHASHYTLNPSPELLWAGGKGKNMMGAANYTIQQSANTLYCVTMNINGDGNNERFPWISTTARESFDVSKLEQWDRILTHFNNVGVAFVFMFAETENETLLTNAQLKLWYREAAARFGHHSAISFVLCEEMKTTTATNAGLLCDYLKSVDGHDRPRGIHTPASSGAHAQYYQPLATHANSNYACVQTKATNFTDVYAATKYIRDWSVGTGKTPWCISIDEARDASNVLPKVDAQDPDHNTARINALWGNLMAGGMGLSFYTTAGGGDNGLVDFTQFGNLMKQCGAAVNFFWDNNIPLGDMAPTDALVSTGRCISANGSTYVIHSPTGTIPTLNLAGTTGKFNVSWLDTKTGVVKAGSVTQVNGGGTVNLGTAPAGLPTDKVILVSNGVGPVTYNLTTSAQNGTIDPSSGTYPEGTIVTLTAKGNLGYKFSAWGGDASGTSNPTNITMNADKNVTATFVPTPIYTLNVAAVNGTVTLNPNENGGQYNEGSVVTLKAVPAVGYKFDSWSGDLTGTEYTSEITMNSTKNVTANFSVEPSLIKNGEFRNGTTNWAIKLVSPADGGVILDNGMAYLEVHIDGTTAQSIIFEQAGINLVNGQNYSLSLDAKAEANRNIEIRLISETSTTTSFPNQTKALTTTMTNIGHEWTHTAASGAYKFQILLGTAGSNDVWVDNIQLLKTAAGPTYTISASAGANGSISPSGNVVVNENANQSFNITPNSGYEVDIVTVDGVNMGAIKTYTFNNVIANHAISTTFKIIVTTNLIQNGDFSNGTTAWNLALTSPAKATFSVVSGEAKVDILTATTTNRNISLEQLGINLIKGHNYTLSFSARAQANRNIVIKCQADAGVVENSFGNQTKAITTTMKTVNHTWTHLASSRTYKIQFFLSNAGLNDVWLDNVQLVDNTINVPVTGVSISGCPSAAMAINATSQLTAYVLPTNATNKLVTWSSSNTTVATVSSTGLVTAKADGSATITGTTDDGGFTSTCDVTVIAVPTYTLNTTALNGSVTLNPAGGTYNEGTVVTLTALPNAGFKFDSWSGHLTSTVNPGTITMTSDKSVTANFSVQTSLIQNGDFSNGTTAWNLALVSPANATFSVVSGEAKVDILTASTTNWHITLEQAGINLINGHNYTLSFNARAQANRNIVIKCQADAGVVENSFGNQTKAITTSMTTVNHTWTHTASSRTYKVQLFLSNAGLNDVWVDNVQIVDNTVVGNQASFAPGNNEIANETESAIRVYPNPASSVLNIELGNSEITKHVKIFNSVGQLIHSVQTENSTEQIELKSFNLKGIIMVQIVNGAEIINRKIMIK